MAQFRDFQPDDAEAINALAVRAFEQFKDAYEDWAEFRTGLARMSDLAENGEIIVAELDGEIVGAVAYIGPDNAKAEFFEPEWAIMRMLGVAPEARGQGIGKHLAKECLNRAIRDGSSVFALHTSEVMTVARPMYQRMGFEWWSSAPMIHGVSYSIYVKQLDC